MTSFKRFFIGFLALLLCSRLHAQLCRGSLGDPVVNITFGSGPNPGPALNAATTNYTFFANDCPNDGTYTIRNNTTACFGGAWYSFTSDHTGDPNGYFMLVNASFQPSDFYLETVRGLCGGTTYEFAAWLMNVINRSNSIKPNITFSIEQTNGTVLGTYQTGDLEVLSAPQWKQYGFFFTTPPGITEVVIRMTNNAPGGNGNDLALDDITFRPCGPKITAGISGVPNNTGAVCEGQAATFTFESSISAGYTSPVYQWQVSSDNRLSWRDIAGASATNYVWTPPTAVGSYQYRMSVAESGNGGIASCRVSSNAITMEVRPRPLLQLVSDGPACEGGIATITGKADMHSDAPWHIPVWSRPGNGSNATTGVSTAPGTNTNTYLLTVTGVQATDAGVYGLKVTNNFGCTAEATTSLVLHPKPVASFTVSGPACTGNALQFAGSTSLPSATRSWSWDLGGVMSASQNPVHTFNDAGNQTIRLSVESDKGCKSDTVTKSVPVYPLPVAGFILPEVCLSDPFAAFMDTSKIADGTESGFTYLWNFGDPGSGTANTSFLKNPTHRYSSVNRYDVQLTVTSGQGCSNSITKVFTVNGSVPQARFTVLNAGTLCSNDSVRLQNNSTVDFGSVTRLEIFWDDGSGSVPPTVDENPVAGAIYSHRYLPDGADRKKYRIRYVVYSGINCQSTVTSEIEINSSPELTFAPLDPVCDNDPSFPITEAGQPTGFSGTATFSGRGVGADGLFQPALAGAGTHVIRYDFTTTAGCSASLERPIVVHPKPVVSAGPDRQLVKGTSFRITGATAQGNNLTYTWSPATNLDHPSTLQPRLTAQADQEYTLTAVTDKGCAASDVMKVFIVSGLFIPDAFTPNGDGHNDAWVIPLLDSYPEAVVRIFNRYGELVYAGTGSNKPWDGTLKGIPQPTGIYVYLIDTKGASPVLKGTVTVIR